MPSDLSGAPVFVSAEAAKAVFDWKDAVRADIPLFKSVGGGLQDGVVAEMILTKALEAGLATPLPIQFETKTRS